MDTPQLRKRKLVNIMFEKAMQFGYVALKQASKIVAKRLWQTCAWNVNLKIKTPAMAGWGQEQLYVYIVANDYAI